MQNLGRLLDSLTRKALDLLTANPQEVGRLMILQSEMTALRIEARQLVKTIRKDVAEAKAGA